MNSQQIMDEYNQAAFASKLARKRFTAYGNLFEAERIILDKLRPSLKDRKLLDIGIGGGRTTRFLLEISRDYTGIDYSAPLIKAAKQAFPREALHQCDVRDMSLFDRGSFDFALFSFNGLDYVPHKDRLCALREIHRVLRPGGWFLFSSHNLSWNNSGQDSSLLHPVQAVKLLVRHWRLQRYEFRGEHYAILNDGLNCSLLVYYVDIDVQLGQLRNIGFGECEAYDFSGKRVTVDCRSPWIHYLSRK